MNQILAALLALLAQPQAAPEPPPPPEEMIDFLGRRRLCAGLPAEAERSLAAQAEWRRLACGALPAEERRLRERYRGDAAALAWLDRDPRDFRLPGPILVHRPEGPPSAFVHRMLWSGTESGGPATFQLTIDSEAEYGGATLFTAAWGDAPARSFRIDNGRFPWLDLQSTRAALGADRLSVELRFGYRRGYCADADADDRPRLTLVFYRDRISASYEDRTNCGFRRVSLTGD